MRVIRKQTECLTCLRQIPAGSIMYWIDRVKSGTSICQECHEKARGEVEVYAGQYATNSPDEAAK